LAVISLAADGAEPAKEKGWTQEQFLITFWCPPPATDQTLAAVAAEHYNLTWVPAEGFGIDEPRHGANRVRLFAPFGLVLGEVSHLSALPLRPLCPTSPSW
jgi:hypothetical protein